MENHNSDIEFEDMIPSNQEALTNIQDLDLTITLPEVSNTLTNKLSEGMAKIRPILEQRLVLAKRKESLRYGIQTGKFPTWFHTRSVCTLNLVDVDNVKFEKFWQETTEHQTKQIAQTVLDYIETEIKSKEMESNSVRVQTLQDIRRQSLDFEGEKRRLDEQITKIHQEQITEIQDFRNRLATMTQTSQHTRDQSGRGRGRPFHRPVQRRKQANRSKPYEHRSFKHHGNV